MNELGKTLYHERLRIHRNQSYYESVGLSQRAVSRIENGEKFPKVHEIYHMMSLLNIDRERLLNVYIETIINNRKKKIPRFIDGAIRYRKWEFLRKLFKRIENEAWVDQERIARTYFVFSSYCYRNRRFRLSAWAFERGLEHIDWDKKKMGKMYVRLSKIYFQYRNDYKEIEYLQKAKSITEDKLKLYVLFRILVIFNKGKHVFPRQDMQELIHLAKVQKANDMLCNIYDAIGYIHYFQDDIPKAIYYAKQGIFTYEEHRLKNEKLRFNLMNNLIYYLLEDGQHLAAKGYIEQCMDCKVGKIALISLYCELLRVAVVEQDQVEAEVTLQWIKANLPYATKEGKSFFYRYLSQYELTFHKDREKAYKYMQDSVFMFVSVRNEREARKSLQMTFEIMQGR